MRGVKMVSRAVVSWVLWISWVPWLLGAAPGAHAEPSPEANATVVVFNSKDPDSADLARFYASQRGIPKERIVGLACPAKEEISRAEFDETIAEPLRAAFSKNNWWELRAADHPLGRVERSKVRFLALIRGMPLRIAATADYPGDQAAGQPQIASRNEASVDSELAGLGAFSRIISGTRANPYFRSYSPILDAGWPDLLLVARLDGPSPAVVRRMITDSIAAEEQGLRGFAYIDARNLPEEGLGEGDKWIKAAARYSRQQGVPVVLDNGEGLFPEAYPMSHAALYYGWYAEQVAGPFARPDFHFQPGAVAVHLHSFSAMSLRDPQRYWCAPLLAAGAAATLGNVYEPFLALTPQLDVFNERLQGGFTLAESAWMSERVISWQTVVVGDPLYRPFKFVNDTTRPPGTTPWDLYREGARKWFREGRPAGEAALKEAAARARSGLLWEGLGLLELTADDGAEAALAAFGEARQATATSEDILRAAIHEVILLRALKRAREADALTQKMTATYPKARACEVLRQIAAEAAAREAGAAPAGAGSRQ